MTRWGVECPVIHHLYISGLAAVMEGASIVCLIEWRTEPTRLKSSHRSCDEAWHELLEDVFRNNDVMILLVDPRLLGPGDGYAD